MQKKTEKNMNSLPKNRKKPKKASKKRKMTIVFFKIFENVLECGGMFEQAKFMQNMYPLGPSRGGRCAYIRV